MASKSPPKRKPRKTPKDTPEKQYQRFLETAELSGADKSPEAFDKAFKKISKGPRG